MSTVWLIEDIANALKAAGAAGQEAALMANNVEYLRGYAACLRFLALTFGLRLANIMPERILDR